MKKLIVFVLLLTGFTLSAQVAPHKYFVEFRDKDQNPFSLDHPEIFLTERAIQRRQAMGIGYELNDLPVTPLYLQTLQNIGAQILNPTKWLNGTTIYLSDTNLADAIRKLPFVKSLINHSNGAVLKGKSLDKHYVENHSFAGNSKENLPENPAAYNYGESYSQIHLVNGDALHQAGFRGQGKVIAQLDAGFYNVPVLPGFDSLRINNQILGYKDFVKNGFPIFNDPNDTHGMNVLSVMAGIIPGHLIGTAPKASYWLLKTEETQHEYETEEYNWVSGAEFADSVGADIITSSLGYTVFDSTYRDHSCLEMNGYTTVCSRGANIAFSKGMIVILSAGNEGDNMMWRCVSTPADADYALACAAVDAYGNRVSFSSVGVDTAGRVKPNIAAMGASSVVMAEEGSVRRSSGTSFSAPVIAGMTACLMQARPGFSNALVKRAIELAGNHYSTPDSLTGFGIPDFVKAMNIIGIDMLKKSNTLSIYPNPVQSEFTLKFTSSYTGKVVFRLSDAVGHIILTLSLEAKEGENSFVISGLTNMNPGIYFVRLQSPSILMTSRMVKLPD